MKISICVWMLQINLTVKFVHQPCTSDMYTMTEKNSVFVHTHTHEILLILLLPHFPCSFYAWWSGFIVLYWQFSCLLTVGVSPSHLVSGKENSRWLIQGYNMTSLKDVKKKKKNHLTQMSSHRVDNENLYLWSLTQFLLPLRRGMK